MSVLLNGPRRSALRRRTRGLLNWRFLDLELGSDSGDGGCARLTSQRYVTVACGAAAAAATAAQLCCAAAANRLPRSGPVWERATPRPDTWQCHSRQEKIGVLQA